MEFVFNTVEDSLTINSYEVENDGISLCHWTCNGISQIPTFVSYLITVDTTEYKTTSLIHSINQNNCL